MNTGSKNKNKTKNQEEEKKETPMMNEKLKEELNRYLKNTEEELKIKQKDEEAILELKKKNEEKYEKMKNLQKESNIEELSNFTLETLKQSLFTELNNIKLNLQNQIQTKDLKSTQELLLAQENKFVEVEKHNKFLLEKVKEMNEEKSKAEKEEKIKREDIRKKCEDFKNDVVSKFQSTDVTTIQADNENLKNKLEEYQENTKKITENLELQLKMKETQNLNFEEQFKTQISSKFNDLKDQTDKFEKENVDLKLEYENSVKKFNNLSGSISKFHSRFDQGKKEFEKSLQEIFKLTKENRDLKLKDLSELEKENSRVKLELETIITHNKSLQEQIAKLKENINLNKNVKKENLNSGLNVIELDENQGEKAKNNEENNLQIVSDKINDLKINNEIKEISEEN